MKPRSAKYRTAELATLNAIAEEVARSRVLLSTNRAIFSCLVSASGELANALLSNASRGAIQAAAVRVACFAVRLSEEGDAQFASSVERTERVGGGAEGGDA